MGNTTTFTYNEYGQVLTREDPGGNITTNVYDGVGNLTEIHYPDGGINYNAFDAQNRRVSTTDPEGNTTTFAYDPAGHLIELSDPEGNVFKYGYDDDGLPRTVEDALGNVYETFYDDMGREYQTIDPMGNTTTNSYDGNGNLTSETDPMGNTTAYEYDELGRSWKTTDPEGHSTTRTFDEEGNVLTETDGCGKTTAFSYDVLGRVVTETDPLENTIEHVYDGVGNEIETIDARGYHVYMTYDDNNRLESTTDHEGNTITFYYDSCGNRIAEQNSEGNTTSYQYDVMKRLIQVVDPEGRVISYGYDLNGNKLFATNGEGKTTTFIYDGANRLVLVTDPEGNTTSYGYDEVGRKASTTDGNGAVTTYEYDVCMQLAKDTDPLGNETSYTYDSCGRVLTKTDPVGTTSFVYDGNGNILQTDYGDSLVDTCTYDGCNRLLTLTNPDSDISLTYDDAGRIERTESPLAVADYSYDSNGNVTGKELNTSTESRTFNYVYDSLNRLVEANSQECATTLNYNATGTISNKTYPNGVVTEYGYNAAQEVSSLEIKKGDSTLKSYSVERDGRANVTSIIEDGTDLTSYTYDNASRLTGESNPHAGNKTYTYDGAGNRLTKTAGLITTAYNYNLADELTSDTDGNAYTYNGRGDLVKVENGTYRQDLSWNAKGELAGVTDTEGSFVSFSYDPLGRTYSSTNGDEVQYHVYDSTSDMELLTLDDSQGITSTYHTGANGLINATTAEGTTYYSYSPHKDTTIITDGSGDILEQLRSDAFGNLTTTTDVPYTYLGSSQRRTVHSLGFIKMGARYYNPNLGRFVSRDPFKGRDEIGISHNPYVYAYDDPVNMTDIMGEDAYSDWLRKWASAHYNSAAIEYGKGNKLAGNTFANLGRTLTRFADKYDEMMSQGKSQPFDQIPTCGPPPGISLKGEHKWETAKVTTSFFYGTIESYAEMAFSVVIKAAHPADVVFSGDGSTGDCSIKIGDVIIDSAGNVDVVAGKHSGGEYLESVDQHCGVMDLWSWLKGSAKWYCKVVTSIKRDGFDFTASATLITKVQLNGPTKALIYVSAGTAVVIVGKAAFATAVSTAPLWALPAIRGIRDLVFGY